MAEKLLNEEIRKQVRNVLDGMDMGVSLLLFKDEENCDYCSTAESLLSELTEVNEKVSLKVYELNSPEAKQFRVEMAPATVFLTADGEDKGVRFYGLPSGHEFGSLLQDILSFSSGAKPELSSGSIERLESIDKPVDIKVFVTPTCPYCPKAVLMGHNIAMANKNITASMVEANEFQELSSKFGVSSVPQIVINEKVIFVGAKPEEDFVNEVFKAL